ncbi:peptide deformylase [Thermocoleostomius sinensis]|jgi:peptide deformylase|uniref:Peptide deformylase n=1 Tax=Thermocoleostomius sinensis A174 TaxID=2016057 RepID=A0A9E8ZEX0_9CYAN|nr:peptide deformylase [Thermocoleostomius sinensis]WAL62109.1 peptide deformylase [Thermocoleostomius sinensis A174]
MTKRLTISQLGDPVLRQLAQPIDCVHDAHVQTLVTDMMTTLVESNGVGLAAPQVGQSLQLLIVASRPNSRYPHAPEMEPTAMINPRLVAHSGEVARDWEGCLSIPGIRGLVPRYTTIDVEYLAQDGTLQQQRLTGFVARIFQHEFDHLNGLVFLDRLESVQDIITDQEYLMRVVASPFPVSNGSNSHINRESN